MFSVLFPVLISSIQRGNKGRKVTDLGGKFSATHKIEEMGEKKKSATLQQPRHIPHITGGLPFSCYY